MPKRSPEQWHQLFKAQQQSGLSAAAFCRKHHLCPKYFSLRRRQLNASPEPPSQTAPPFIRAQVQATQPPIQLTWQNTHLQLPTTVSPQWLVELIKALP